METVTITKEQHEALGDMYMRFHQIHDTLERYPCDRGQMIATMVAEGHFTGEEAKRILEAAKGAFEEFE